jgi:hypothetical protein
MKKFRYNFTLMELLVAMAVLAILLVLMMQFFSGAQKVWTSSEQKSNMYADARIVMDLCSVLLQNTYYDVGGYPFEIKRTLNRPSDGWNDEICFASSSELELKGTSDVRFFKLKRDNTNTNSLFLYVYANDKSDFSYFVPPFDSSSKVPNYSEAVKQLNDIFSSSNGYSQKIELLNTVTGFQIIPKAQGLDGSTLRIGPYSESFPPGYKVDTTGNGTPENGNGTVVQEIPFLIEFAVSLMSPENFKIWQEMQAAGSPAAAAYRSQHEYTFRRAVFLGNRWHKK